MQNLQMPRIDAAIPQPIDYSESLRTIVSTLQNMSKNCYIVRG